MDGLDARQVQVGGQIEDAGEEGRGQLVGGVVAEFPEHGQAVVPLTVVVPEDSTFRDAD